jgi:uncharacterized RmlC-like cupin family protein
MDQTFTYLEDLAAELAEIPPDSIISQTIYQDEQFKAILHTASQTALLYFVQGQAKLTLGEEKSRAVPGTWVRMAPRLPHSVLAETKLVMLLILFKG